MIIDSSKMDQITPKGCHALGRKLCHPFGILSFTYNFLQFCHPFGIETAQHQLNKKQSTDKQKDGEQTPHVAKFASGGRPTVLIR